MLFKKWEPPDKNKPKLTRTRSINTSPEVARLYRLFKPAGGSHYTDPLTGKPIPNPDYKPEQKPYYITLAVASDGTVYRTKTSESTGPSTAKLEISCSDRFEVQTNTNMGTESYVLQMQSAGWLVFPQSRLQDIHKAREDYKARKLQKGYLIEASGESKQFGDVFLEARAKQHKLAFESPLAKKERLRVEKQTRKIDELWEAQLKDLRGEE